jgi:phage gpG-like protein
MFRFRLEVAGEVQMDRGIARFADGVADYRPVWPVIEDEFYGIEKAQFQTQGAEGGDAWKTLTPEYAAWKEAHFPGKPILQRTGDLVRSLTTASDPNAVHIEGRKTLTLGSKIPYAIYHQTGTIRMDERPEIRLSEQHRRLLMNHVHVYLVEIASKSGFRTGLAPTVASKFGSLFGAGIAPHGTSPRRSGSGDFFNF